MTATARAQPAPHPEPLAAGSRAESMTLAGLLTVTVLAAALTPTGISAPRLVATLIFATAAPGWAIVGWLPLPGAALRWVAAIGLSISVCLLVATGMLILAQWQPEPVMLALQALTAVALAGRLARDAAWARRGIERR